MSDTIAWLSMIISVFSLLTTIFVTYLTYFRLGKIVLSKPSYIGARQLAQQEIDAAVENKEVAPTFTQENDGLPEPAQDLIFIPLSVVTTETKPRVLRFKLVLNNTYVYHGNYELNLTKLSSLKNPASFLLPASGNTVIPRQVFSKVLCFSQLPLLTGLKEPPIFDLWYEERECWRKGFRVIWSDWSKLKGTFDQFGYIGTSENYEYKTEFTPDYGLDLLTK